MRLSKSWWAMFIVSTAIMIAFAAPYLTFNPDASRTPIVSLNVQYPLLVAHIAAASLALIAGFIQFIPRLRNERPRVHRILGRIYVGSVFISGLIALALIFYIDEFSKAAGFLALSLAWLFTGWKGYRAAVKRNAGEHRLWMTRNFGITLVAVTARILVPVLLLVYYAVNGFALPEGRQVMIEEVLNVNIWAGLVVQIIIVEWIVLRSRRGDARG